MSTDAFPPAFKGVYAFVFDLIGTLTDSQAPVTAAFEAHARPHASLAKYDHAFWDRFSYDWDQAHGVYLKGLAARNEYLNEEATYLTVLNAQLEAAGISEFTEAERRDIVKSWAVLPAWKDTVPGLDALRTKFATCPLSNGSARKLIESNKRNGMQFDMILPSTVTRQYKPNPQTYLTAIKAFDLESHPGECLGFVAAHWRDLSEAGKHGFKTVYIKRATEDRDGAPPDIMASFDLVIEEGGIVEMARWLGAL